MHYLYLSAAIVVEVIGTSMLKVSDGFSKLWPSVATIASYTVAIVLLSFAVKVIPVGVAYAIWSGVGVALITVVGWIAFKEHLSPAALFGIGLIVAGVLVLQILGGETTAL